SAAAAESRAQAAPARPQWGHLRARRRRGTAATKRLPPPAGKRNESHSPSSPPHGALNTRPLVRQTATLSQCFILTLAGTLRPWLGQYLYPIQPMPRQRLTIREGDPHCGEPRIHDVLTVTRAVEPALDHLLHGLRAIRNVLAYELFPVADRAHAIRRRVP